MFPYLHGTLGRAGFVGAYDDIPNLVHLYEMARRGLTSYTGNLVRIRRSSDDATQDFGYVANGDLDTAAIAAFIGGSSGYVVTVYDQVGGNNVTQADPTKQPAYVSNGQNGKPIMRLNGTSQYLQGAFSGFLSQPYSTYSAAKLDVAAVNDNVSRVVFDGDDVTNRTQLFKSSAPTPDGWQLYSGAIVSGLAANSNFNLFSGLVSGALSEFWRNQTSQGTGDAGSLNIDGITIGSSYNGQFYWRGDIAVVAIADPSNDASDRTAMETAINDYYAAYIPPTATIASSESSPTAANTIPITITFSEEVAGFAVGDIAVANGSAGNFATSDNIVFTADITPAAVGVVTVDIDAGVCQDLDGNGNAAASQFSIFSYLGIVLQFEGSDAPMLFTDDSITTPVSMDGDAIGSIEDIIGGGFHVSQSDVNKKPLYKTGIQAGKSIIRFDGTDDILGRTATDPPLSTGVTIVAIAKTVDVNRYLLTVGGYYNASAVKIRPVSGGWAFGLQTAAQSPTDLSISCTPTSWCIVIASYSASTGVRTIRVNESSATDTITASNINQTVTNLYLGGGRHNTLVYSNFSGDCGLVHMYPSALSEASQIALEEFLNTRWAVFLEAGVPVYASPDGDPNEIGTLALPMTLDVALSTGRDVLVMGGVYTFDSVTVSAGQTLQAVEGAVPIVVHSDGGPPTVTIGNAATVEGLWFGGVKPEQIDVIRLVSVAANASLIDCTFFGYIDAIGGGANDNNLYDGCRFVNCGYEHLHHPMYFTSQPVGIGATVQNCIYVVCDGFAMHWYHQPTNGISNNNFVGKCYAPLAFEGTGHAANKNIFWDTQTVGLFFTAGDSSVDNCVWSGVVPGATLTGDRTMDGNCYLNGAVLGTNYQSWDETDVVNNLGDSSVNIDAAIAALDAAFQQAVAEIQADSNIETYFSTLRAVIDSWGAI